MLIEPAKNDKTEFAKMSNKEKQHYREQKYENMSDDKKTKLREKAKKSAKAVAQNAQFKKWNETRKEISYIENEIRDIDLDLDSPLGYKNWKLNCEFNNSRFKSRRG